MKKIILTLTAIIGVALLAEGQSLPIPGRHTNKRKLNGAIANKFKATLIKPLIAKDYTVATLQSANWDDSIKYNYTYYPDGNIKSSIVTDMSTGNIIVKQELTYDQKGMLDISKEYLWDGTQFVFNSEYGQTKTFDAQQRMTSLNIYNLDAQGDTLDGNEYYGIIYKSDSVIINYYLEGQNAPGDLFYKYEFYKTGAASTWNTEKIYAWNETEYLDYIITKIEWNGTFDVEKVLYMREEHRILYKYGEYQYTYAGVTTTGRIKGTVTASKETEIDENKVGVIYIPNYEQSYTIDSHQKVTLDEYKSSYNTVTQSYDDYQTIKTDYTYDQNNLLRELMNYKDAANPDYIKIEEIVYEDFQDVSGISGINKAQKILVSPNPTSGMVNFVVEGEILSVECSDMLGRKIALSATTRGNVTSADMSQLGAGMYVVTITTDKGLSQGLVELLK